MKTIVIYNSQTGFTKKYAQWISESLSADCVELNTAKKLDLSSYDAIIFGGWAFAGSITKLKWFKKNISKWQGKKLAVFCVGASPIENPDIANDMPKNFSEEELKVLKWFYCPGGLNYDKMSVTSRSLMKMLAKSLETKKNKTQKDIEQAKMISSSYDISDIKYIEPIVKYIKG